MNAHDWAVLTYSRVRTLAGETNLLELLRALRDHGQHGAHVWVVAGANIVNTRDLDPDAKHFFIHFNGGLLNIQLCM